MALALVLGVSLANAVAPAVTIDPASSVSYTSAHLSGTVDPQDQEASYHFEYSTDEVNWNPASSQGPIAAGAGIQIVADDLTGLAPGTEYFVRLVAENVDGQTVSAEPNPSFTTAAVAPPTVSIDPVTSITGSSAHFSETIDPEAPGGNPSAFDVFWHFQCTPSCSDLEGGQIPADSSSHVVEAGTKSLDPNTNYEVTLIASNAGGQASAGPEAFKTEAVAPRVQNMYAGFVNADSAKLAARVNPGNSPVTYQFEWGPDDNYGNVAPATPQALGAEDNSFHFVIAPLSALQPGSTYHFRIVATNTETAETSAGVDHSFSTTEPAGPSEPTSCPNEALRTGPSAALPDCRAYEMVSPPAKGGQVVLSATVLDPNHVNFLTTGSILSSDPGANIAAVYQASRTADWTTAPGQTSSQGLPVDVNADLSQGVASDLNPLTPEDHDLHGADVYTVRNGKVELASVGSVGGDSGQPAIYSGESANGDRILFRTKEVLEPEDVNRDPEANQLYERFDGATHVVGILPDEQCAALGRPSGCVDPKGAVLAGDGSSAPTTFRGGGKRAVSQSGSRVFFESPDPDTFGDPQLYLREGGQTTFVSASQRSVPGNGPKPVRFWGASASGDVVYFATVGQLTDDDEDTKPDLYRYEVDSGDLIRVSAGDTGAVEDGGVEFGGCGGVCGVVTVSDDGEIVYFIATNALAKDAIAGAENLYVYSHQDEEVKLVATLGPNDGGIFLQPGLSVGSFVQLSMSPSGHSLVFLSYARLTPFDNQDVGTNCATVGGTLPCPEIYRYDQITGTLSCVSCSSDGHVPFGPVNLRMFSAFASNRVANVFMADDGASGVFEASDSLLPEDVNNRKSDVYEWSSDGDLHLISSGHSQEDSFLIGMTRDGSDVFLMTEEQLVGKDTDRVFDLYDARIGGGFSEPPPSPSPCSGDGCQGAPGAPPPPATPGTDVFKGPGNTVKSRRARCPRDKVRRKGKCTKRAAKHRANHKRRAGR